MIGLTAKQAALLRFIQSHMAEHGIAPSFDEMRANAGLASKSGVMRLLEALQDRGAIRRRPYRARAIEIVAQRGGPDLGIRVDEHGDVTIEFGQTVTREWWLRHAPAIKAAMSKRMSSVVYPPPEGDRA